MYICVYIHTFVYVHVFLYTYLLKIDFRMIYMIKGRIAYYRRQSHKLLCPTIWKYLTRGTNNTATVQSRRSRCSVEKNLYSKLKNMMLGRNR